MDIWFDRFAKEFVTKLDCYAPPERYYQMFLNVENENEYQEKWRLENNMVAVVKYSIYATHEDVFKLRAEMEKEFGSACSYLISYTLPKIAYDEMLKELDM